MLTRSWESILKNGACPNAPLLRRGQIFMKDVNVPRQMKNENSIFFLFMVKNSSKIDHSLSSKMTITGKIEKPEKSENWIFIRFSTFRIFHVNINTSEILRKNKLSIWLNDNFQSNPHLSCKFEHFWTTFFYWSVNFW